MWYLYVSAYYGYLSMTVFIVCVCMSILVNKILSYQCFYKGYLPSYEAWWQLSYLNHVLAKEPNFSKTSPNTWTLNVTSLVKITLPHIHFFFFSNWTINVHLHGCNYWYMKLNLVWKITGRSGGWNEEAKARTQANNGNVQYCLQRSTNSKTKGTRNNIHWTPFKISQLALIWSA